ncbi:TPM domain-containing protein [Allosphingosinicella sp.]|jgi:uncharacterized protein|uniref:TPM domain-containing protein n=1 Tax=Allosphingosinicella sp. TaxID=2823234 RepID=UPI002F1B73D6
MTRAGFLVALAAQFACLGCSNEEAPKAPPQNLSAAAPSAADFRITQRVTDQADLLDPAAEARLTRVLADFERRTAHQLVVVTVTSLDGRDVADYTRDLANRSGIGRADQDDGVVLLVAPQERRMRIAVGIGLESVLTNEICREIIESVLVPRFRQVDFAGGIEAGVAALIARLDQAPGMSAAPR